MYKFQNTVQNVFASVLPFSPRAGNARSPGVSWSCFIEATCPGYRHWSNAEFAKAHNSERNVFPGADDSWLEARMFNTLAIQAVPASHPLSGPLQEESAPSLQPTPVRHHSRRETERVREFWCHNCASGAFTVSFSLVSK